MWKRTTIGFGLWALISIGGTGACTSNAPDESEGAGNGFESDDPSLRAWVPGPAFDDSGSEAFRAYSRDVENGMVEADIVQVDGDRLYALSPSGDLSVIGLETNDELRLLGRFRTQAAKPLEIHLLGQVVLAVYSGPKNQLVAIDTSDPESIGEIGQFEVAGAITDSWLVGDVLYLVSHRAGDAKSVVTSLNVENPSSIRKLDELSFTAKSYGAATMTDKRIYVASPEGEREEGAPSTIRIIDIEGSRGQLTLGASVTARGRISSPWQMDEHDGVLRVISQSDRWGAPEAPQVQTFEVASPGELRSLGSLDLTVPLKTVLKSVRFDGPRAYASVGSYLGLYDKLDALFTLDLSNPNQPEQKGELSTRGFIEHMDPRGDRLYALGFSYENTKGTLNASIIDVTDPSNPTMLDRVEFGGRWSTLPGGQKRIDRAFQLLPDAGLALVPFSAYVFGDSCDRHMSGVQLIELGGDSLTKGGVALSRGGARRALFHEDRLISVGYEQAEVFDIGKRGEPKSLASVKIGHRVDRTLPHGDKLIRLAIDPWTKAASLEIVRADDADTLEPIGSIEIDQALAGSGDPSCGYDELHRENYLRMFADGAHVYVVAPRPYWQNREEGTTVLVVDIEDPKAPRIVNTEDYEFSVWYWDQTGQNWGTTLIEAGSNLVQIGHTLAAIEPRYSPYEQGTQNVGDKLHILDFQNPEAPRHRTIELPQVMGRTKLHAHEGAIMLGHWVPVPEKPGRVRFYLDRIDIDNPSEPVLKASVNIPGSLLSFDEESGRFVTVDYRREVLPGETRETCRGPSWHFDSETETCTVVHRTVNLLDISGDSVAIVDSKELSDDLWVAKALKGDDRVTLVDGTRHDDMYCDCGPGYYVPSYDGESVMGEGIVIVGGARDGELDLVSPTLSEGGFTRIASSGQWLVKNRSWDSTAEIIDLRNLDEPVERQVSGFRSYIQSLAVGDDRAFFSLGEYGLKAFTLAD